MFLPESVLSCLNTLEQAGFPCYAVGGCVRDSLLGRIPHDYDLCTAATPAEIKMLFSRSTLVLAGEKHGTVGVVTAGGVIEITTFRTEGGYLDSRHPDWVNFVSDITEDLARRDFTVNAMAYSPIRGLCDPFGGQDDLNNRVLRAVGQPHVRFTEDPLRILRGVRFAVRYQLEPDPDTKAAMEQLLPLMDKLARERVFDELCKLLPSVSAADLCRFSKELSQVIPELGATVGFDQHSSHHRYDVYTHTAYVVESTPPELALRWAALLHDIGKVPTFTLDEEGKGHFLGHAGKSADMANDILHRLKAPNALREQVVQLIRQHMTPLEAEKKQVRRRLSRLGIETLTQLLQLQKADFLSKGVSGKAPDFALIEALIEEILRENSCLSIKDLAVNGHDLMAMGFTGPQIGRTLDHLLTQVLEEAIPNEKEALLCAAKESTSEVTI